MRWPQYTGAVLTIRKVQLDAFARAERAQFVERMCTHLRTHFTDELSGLDNDKLKEQVSSEIDRAATYGLTTEQDCCRFLSVGAACGWRFEEKPENAWMKACLRDGSVSSPSMRLRLLVDELLHRRTVEAENRKLASASWLLPGEESA